jgi:tryptophan synthase alpha chain
LDLKFCHECAESGVSGSFYLIYLLLNLKNYQKILEKHHLNFTFLVTPETSDERILYLDSLSSGFLYAVSSSSTTGNENTV